MKSNIDVILAVILLSAATFVISCEKEKRPTVFLGTDIPASSWVLSLDELPNDGVIDKGNDTTIYIGINTSLPKADIIIDADPWITASIDGRIIILQIEANYTGEIRTGRIIVSDAKGRVTSSSREIRQSFFWSNRLGMVQFNDYAFKKACLEIADDNTDGDISFEEAATVRELLLADKGIKDLKGLDAFVNVWKLDLENNDICDGTILKNLHHLHWLEVKGNPGLSVIDISGCSLYFEHLEIDPYSSVSIVAYYNQLIAEDYYIYVNGEQTSSRFYRLQDYLSHIKYIEDTRESVDFSFDKKMVLVKEHTKGSGRLAMVFSGYGFLDIDYQDGSVDRLMKKLISLLSNWRAFKYKDNIECFDLYYMCLVNKTRDQIDDEYAEWNSTINAAFGGAFGVISPQKYGLNLILYNVNHIINFCGGSGFRGKFLSTGWNYLTNVEYMVGCFSYYDPNGIQLVANPGGPIQAGNYGTRSIMDVFENNTDKDIYLAVFTSTRERIRSSTLYEWNPEFWPIMSDLELLEWNHDWDVQ